RRRLDAGAAGRPSAMIRPLWAALFGLVVAAGAVLGAPKPGGCCGCCQPWAGVYPTVLTPWNCDCTVDEASLEAQLRYEMAGGVTGVLVLGSIGEGEYATPDVRAQMLRTTARVVNGCVPIVVGIHTCDPEVAQAQMLQAREHG